MNHCFFPRVAFTQKGRIFLIGGSKNNNQTEVINNTYELLLTRSGRATRRRPEIEPELKEKAPMSLARLGFGCAVDNYGEKIFAIGGSLGKQKPTDLAEYYNVEEDRWNVLPKL